jgi:NADH dehydrogenase FAD-containing subunit
MLDIFHLIASPLQQAIAVTFHFLTAHYFQSPTYELHSPHDMKNIVILGGSYAGISTAHRLLKHAPKTTPFKITLVSPNTHFYWNLASARAVIPGQFSDDELFRPIAPGFSQYPSSRFEFILGSADQIDVEKKKLSISVSSGITELSYDFLILATGSHATDGVPFKGLGSTEATKDYLHDFQQKVQKSKRIVVAGAGITGVEVAGELAFEYGKEKEIILVC